PPRPRNSSRRVVSANWRAWGEAGLFRRSAISPRSSPFLPFSERRCLPDPRPFPGPAQLRRSSPRCPGARSPKTSPPPPQDRICYSFNFFAEVNQHLNPKFEASVDGLRVYRESFGFEKTFNDGNGSLGMRLPINTVNANSTIRGNFAKLAGGSTAVGDLS